MKKEKVVKTTPVILNELSDITCNVSFEYENNTYDFVFHRYFLISWNIDICCEAECKRLVLEHGNRIFISCNA